MDESLSAAAITATAGAALSLFFNIVPGVRTWYDRLSTEAQRGAMAVMVVLTGVGMALWQCNGGLGNGPAPPLCGDGIDWWALATSIVFAASGNQSIDRITPKPRASDSATAESTTARQLVNPTSSSSPPSPPLDHRGRRRG